MERDDITLTVILLSPTTAKILAICVEKVLNYTFVIKLGKLPH